MSSIISKGRNVEWLGGYLGFGLLVLVFLMMYSGTVWFTALLLEADISVNLPVLVFIVSWLAVISAMWAIRPLAFFKDATRFNNVRNALSNGYVAIVTNKDDTLREVADEISNYLKRLGIDHFGSGKYANHLVVENEDCFYQASSDDLGSRKPEKCKLTLVLFARATGNNGVVSIKYCLLDNGSHSVIFIDSCNEWPYVDCSAKTTPRVAKEIVGGIFEKLNLIIRAGTVSAN